MISNSYHSLHCIFVFLKLPIYLFHYYNATILMKGYSNSYVNVTHALFTLLVQCMEFTLSYYDITFCMTWCNKVASTKTCHLMLLQAFLTDMF